MCIHSILRSACSLGSCDEPISVGGNDDGTDCDHGAIYSFTAMDGVLYFILVHGYEEQSGTFDLVVQCASVPNDDRTGALPVSCNQTISGNTSFATLDNVADRGTGIDPPGIWYTFITGMEPLDLS